IPADGNSREDNGNRKAGSETALLNFLRAPNSNRTGLRKDTSSDRTRKTAPCCGLQKPLSPGAPAPSRLSETARKSPPLPLRPRSNQSFRQPLRRVSRREFRQGQFVR